MRKIKMTFQAKPTKEGAGVKLKRVFGYDEVPLLDPFLLLDNFGSNNPDDYLAGFPWHPHRGIETITYMIHGKLKHEDSMGNGGIIRSGGIQWMTAGSGIIHQEMPKRTEGMMRGFQLWANLPSSHKMMDPRYRDITSEMITTVKENDSIVKIICGEYKGKKGPVQDIVTKPQYYDISLSPESEFIHHFPEGHTVFAYVFEGQGYFDENKDPIKREGQLILYEDGREIHIFAENHLRFLLVSGKPIGEPVAWYGPIVMNKKKELERAFKEFREGMFLKSPGNINFDYWKYS
ncbi:MAG: pirin family protein [Candidatus Lokiarchaeota archaeon]|nr:pirin family protein [Candidatus Lokiarchaeota archaeon]MBD3342932.1 pirin family protein [Candidatus Lokiarchaeota archaeon]